MFLMSFINAKDGNNKVFDGAMLTFAAPAKMGEINGVPLGYMTGISREMIANALLKKLIRPGTDTGECNISSRNHHSHLRIHSAYAK